MAYSANAAPEESSRTSGRVMYAVTATQAPKKKPWPIIIAAIVLVLAVGAVVAFLLRPTDDKPGGSVPDVRGTYRGTMINQTTNKADQVEVTLTQDGSELTGTLKSLVVDTDLIFLGSGTVTPAGQVNLRFEAGDEKITLDGSRASPGRLTGTWKFDNGSGTGTWDLCTCIS